jgi:hypothetical protein
MGFLVFKRKLKTLLREAGCPNYPSAIFAAIIAAYL